MNRSEWVDADTWRDPDCIECGGDGAPCCEPPDGPPPTSAAKVIEHDTLRYLRARYGARHGNGDRWAFATHVRSAAGFDATRTADAVAMDLWPSKGLALHGHEVKVSRSDWLRELQKPDKWQPVGRYMDRWWVVVPDAAIVRPGELPPEWGLIVATSGATRITKQAPKLDAKPVTRTFLAALLRAAARTARVDALAVQR